MKFFINNKYEKGITLVALVVTIIVLLILSGVTIVNITGGNGPIQNASDAKSDSQKKDIQDKLQMSLVTAFTEKGDTDVSSVKRVILENFKGATVKNNEFPLEVVIDNTSFLINEDSTVAEKIYE